MADAWEMRGVHHATQSGHFDSVNSNWLSLAYQLAEEHIAVRKYIGDI